MAIKVSEAAKGNAPATGMEKTPPPTKTVDTQALIREQAWGGAGSRPGGGNPGMNRYAGGVSLPPGVKAQPATIDPTAPVDPVLDRLRSRSLADAKAGGNELDLQSPQTRDIGRDFPPAHSAMKRQQADIADIGRPKLPADIDRTNRASPAEALRKPGD
jgi:hypothetical protein